MQRRTIESFSSLPGVDDIILCFVSTYIPSGRCGPLPECPSPSKSKRVGILQNWSQCHIQIFEYLKSICQTEIKHSDWLKLDQLVIIFNGTTPASSCLFSVISNIFTLKKVTLTDLASGVGIRTQNPPKRSLLL